jgi:hypothetical protein
VYCAACLSACLPHATQLAELQRSAAANSRKMMDAYFERITTCLLHSVCAAVRYIRRCVGAREKDGEASDTMSDLYLRQQLTPPCVLLRRLPACFAQTTSIHTQLAELQRSAAANSRKMMDAYFERIKRLSANDKLESRLRFMLLDVVEQRQRGWETRRKKEGPKKIEVGLLSVMA